MSITAGLCLRAGLEGITAGPLTQMLDGRWLMAYAAALGEEDPRYFDTIAPHGPPQQVPRDRPRAMDSTLPASRPQGTQPPRVQHL